MPSKKELSDAGWYNAYRTGSGSSCLDPFSTLPDGPHLLARTILANHLGGPLQEEHTSGLLQADHLSKEALINAKRRFEQKNNAKHLMKSPK